MADDPRILKRLAMQGIAPLSVTEAHSAMEDILANEIVQSLVMDVDWRRMRMGPGAETPAMLESLRERLLVKPDVFPRAAEIASVDLVLNEGRVKMKAEVHAADRAIVSRTPRSLRRGRI